MYKATDYVPTYIIKHIGGSRMQLVTMTLSLFGQHEWQIRGYHSRPPGLITIVVADFKLSGLDLHLYSFVRYYIYISSNHRGTVRIMIGYIYAHDHMSL